MNEYLAMWRNYVNFRDRTTVKGYWMAVLINLAVSFAVGFVARMFSLSSLSYLYSLAILVPCIAICVRRLHDMGRSWSWIFIALIPLVGWIWMIVLLCQPSVADDGFPAV